MGPTRTPRQFLAAAVSQARSLARVFVDSLERRRAHQLTLVALLALGLGSYVASMVVHIRHAKNQWSSQETLLVASRLIEQGEEISVDNTRPVDLPVALTPDGFIRSLAPGTHAAITLTERTPITSAMVERGTPRTKVPVGWRGVALPADLVAPAVHEGDRVDIVAGNSIVTTNALVLGVGPDSQIVVAVPSAHAVIVASAARLGDVSLILSS